MREVAVLTDSVACLPPELAQRYDIGVVPVRVTAAGREYRDTADDLPPATVRQLQLAPALDTTPWPPETYRRAYRDAGATARSVLHVVAFSQFTSTISLARTGAALLQQEMPGLRVEVFDAATTAMSQGFIALAAARASAEGADLTHVLARAAKVRERVSAAFTLDSLRYLARTGRVPRLTAWASSLLHVMPVVGLAQGQERPIALVRSAGQGARRLLDFVRDRSTAGEPLHVAVMASDRSDEGALLLESILARYHPIESLLVTPSPVTQAVAGPGLLGVALYCGE